MKKLKIYFKGEFVMEIKYERIHQNNNAKCWEVFLDDKLSLSAFIPFNHLIVKENISNTFEITGKDLLGIINSKK